MKNIPIIILNKDRLDPLKLLVDSLLTRGYDNILIIDNLSTYEPLLEWYKSSKLNVFHNNEPKTLYDNSTFHRLAVTCGIPRFAELMKTHYVYTDSDVVLTDDVPVNFIEHMIEVVDEYNVDKVGLGLKIDDLPDTNYAHHVISCEKPYWSNLIPHPKYELYNAPVDTTFAVYGPNKNALWSNNTIRMGGNYMVRHIPWYYDVNNLPEDELHYLKHLQPGKGPVFSMTVKNMLFGRQR